MNSSPVSERSHFFSCDWGTTSFRLRLVSARDLRPVGELREDAGVKTLQMNLPESTSRGERASVFGRFLRGRLEELGRRCGVATAGCPVVVSGMASSNVGWHELPYARTPFPIDGSQTVVTPIPDSELGEGAPSVWLVSGVRTQTDIMRGEECEILGVAAGRGLAASEDRCVVVLPGTHSKHAFIEGGTLTDFRTQMTGELCEVLGRHSLLRLSVRWPPEDPEPTGDERDAFVDGVRLASDGGLGPHLFRVRTRTVLEGVKASVNGWFLSGLIIGDEVRRLAKDPENRRVILAGSSRFSPAYSLALEQVGLGSRLEIIDPAAMESATPRAHAMLLGRVMSKWPKSS